MYKNNYEVSFDKDGDRVYYNNSYLTAEGALGDFKRSFDGVKEIKWIRKEDDFSLLLNKVAVYELWVNDKLLSVFMNEDAAEKEFKVWRLVEGVRSLRLIKRPQEQSLIKFE